MDFWWQEKRYLRYYIISMSALIAGVIINEFSHLWGMCLCNILHDLPFMKAILVGFGFTVYMLIGKLFEKRINVSSRFWVILKAVSVLSVFGVSLIVSPIIHKNGLKKIYSIFERREYKADYFAYIKYPFDKPEYIDRVKAEIMPYDEEVTHHATSPEEQDHFSVNRLYLLNKIYLKNGYILTFYKKSERDFFVSDEIIAARGVYLDKWSMVTDDKNRYWWVTLTCNKAE